MRAPIKVIRWVSFAPKGNVISDGHAVDDLSPYAASHAALRQHCEQGQSYSGVTFDSFHGRFKGRSPGVNNHPRAGETCGLLDPLRDAVADEEHAHRDADAGDGREGRRRGASDVGHLRLGLSESGQGHSGTGQRDFGQTFHIMIYRN